LFTRESDKKQGLSAGEAGKIRRLSVHSSCGGERKGPGEKFPVGGELESLRTRHQGRKKDLVGRKKEGSVKESALRGTEGKGGSGSAELERCYRGKSSLREKNDKKGGKIIPNGRRKVAFSRRGGEKRSQPRPLSSTTQKKKGIFRSSAEEGHPRVWEGK